MSAMNFCILGLGSIGRRHARNLKQLGREVIGFDPSPAARESFRQEGGETVDTREQGLARADAIVIATPNQSHGDDLRDAVAAGSHVFIEKPMAHRTEALPELVASADEQGLVVFPGLNQRFNPAVAAARERIADGSLGMPLWARFSCASYLPDWRPGTDYRKGYAADPRTGGVLFDLLHEFDMAHHLLGDTQVVCAAARNTGMLEIEAEDCADVLLRHESGVQSALHLDYVTRPPLRGIEVAGSEGYLKIDVRARGLARWRNDGTLAEERTFDSTADAEYLAQMRQFLNCIDHGEQPACPPREAIGVLQQVIDARALCGLPTA